MNCGLQKNTIKKYLLYIEELINTHHNRSFIDKINLKDTQLLKKYKISDYNYFIKTLFKLELISDIGDYFIPCVKTKYYKLSYIKYINLYNIYVNNYSNNINQLYIYHNQYKVELLDQSQLTLDINDDENVDIESESNISKVKFGKVKIKADFDDETVKNILKKNYPQLIDYQILCTKLNKCIWTCSNHILFEPNIKRSSKNLVTKISIRATQMLSATKCLQNHPETPYEDSREYILDQSFGNEWSEFDVSGSVPRLARFISYNIWEDLSVDPYEVMFKNQFSVWDKPTRDLCKQFFMRLYFGGSPKEILRDIRQIKEDTPLKDFTLDSIIQFKNIVKEYTGCDDTRNTEIFLHESCIYMSVLKKLANSHIPVYQVYDAFFMREIPKDFQYIIKSCAEEYRQKYV